MKLLALLAAVKARVGKVITLLYSTFFLRVLWFSAVAPKIRLDKIKLRKDHPTNAMN